jgi:hypothetical protein
LRWAFSFSKEDFDMVDFKHETRKRCRHCKMKLPEPTSNEREAFCTRGCYNSFYLHRCRVCEKPIEQPRRGTRLLCKKPRCQTAWQRKDGMGRYATVTLDKGVVAEEAKAISEVPANQAVLSAPKPVDRWRIIAGPALTPSQFHCATLPGTAMDEVLWIEAKNKTILKAVKEAEIEANGYFTETVWREVISPDGVRCFVTRFRDAPKAKPRAMPPIPDDLSIPPFLDRRPRPELQVAA